MDKTIQKQIENLLKAASIEAKVTVVEENETFMVTIDGDDNALLIGKHGNTLSSLEHIIALMVAKNTGEFKHVTVEVGDYRKEREEYLRDLVSRLKEEVLTTGVSKSIQGLKPWERRLVHMYLADDTDVVTESEGEDRERTLYIKKK